MDTPETAELATEQKAFDAQIEELMKTHRGQFALVKNGTAVGFFKRHDDAFREGLARFGLDTVFLISQVALPQPQVVSLAWDAGVMFGA